LDLIQLKEILSEKEADDVGLSDLQSQVTALARKYRYIVAQEEHDCLIASRREFFERGSAQEALNGKVRRPSNNSLLSKP
jgi:hypothetical protein